MKPYEYLPHTADVKFIARGKTLEKAFENAAYALTDTITDHTKIKQTEKQSFFVESEDEKSLLYDFLEQFIILLDSEGFLLNKIESLKITPKGDKLTLICKIVGDIQNDKYEIKTTIKAVTYQQMEVKKANGEYKLQVILDI